MSPTMLIAIFRISIAMVFTRKGASLARVPNGAQSTA
jgi:hypothetical protein